MAANAKVTVKDVIKNIPAGVQQVSQGITHSAIDGLSALGTAIGTRMAPKAPPEIILIDKNHPAPPGYVPPGVTPVSLPKPAGPKMAAAAVMADTDDHMSPQELQLLRNVLYAEISNRSQDKRQLESKVIINTALNRAKAKGTTLTKVLTAPNQYQGYNSKQYQIAASRQGNTDKLTAIDGVLSELEQGHLTDNTNGAKYYIHNKDGSITYDDTRAY